MARPRRGERRQIILETLAHMLEKNQGEHITAAPLARAVGVSRAAPYRPFASKAKMFEGLLEFIEETLFTRINKIIADESRAEARVQNILFLLLGFADKNPGMARLLYWLMQAVTATMTRRAESPDDVPGVPTGIAEYDRRTGGLHPGELTIIAARPSVGKTSLAVHLLLND